FCSVGVFFAVSKSRRPRTCSLGLKHSFSSAFQIAHDELRVTPSTMPAPRIPAILAKNLRKAKARCTWEALYYYYWITGRALARGAHKVKETNAHSFKAYTPKRYKGCLTLFRATQLSVPQSYDPELAWKGLARGALEIYDVPGDHITAL